VSHYAREGGGQAGTEQCPQLFPVSSSSEPSDAHESLEVPPLSARALPAARPATRSGVPRLDQTRTCWIRPGVSGQGVPV